MKAYDVVIKRKGSDQKMSEKDSKIISNYKNLSPSNKKLVKDYITIVSNVQSNTERDIERNRKRANA